MKTTKNTETMFSARTVLLSAVIMIASTASAAGTFDSLSESSSSMPILYILGAIFLFGFLIHVLGNHFGRKEKAVVRTSSAPANSVRQRHHYRRVIKKSA